MKTLKSIAILLLIIGIYSDAYAQTKKPDSIRGSLTSNPPIDGWFINGRFVADKNEKQGLIEWKQTQEKPIRVYSNGTYKVQIPNSTNYWVFSSLDDNKRVALLVKDTLFIHKDLDAFKGIKEQVFELRYLSYKGKIYRYSYMFVDKAYFYTQHRKGVEIW